MRDPFGVVEKGRDQEVQVARGRMAEDDAGEAVLGEQGGEIESAVREPLGREADVLED